MTLAEWTPRWRAGIVDLRPSTLAHDDGYVDRYILPTFGSRRLADIDHAAVTVWVAEMVTIGPVLGGTWMRSLNALVDLYPRQP